MMDTTADEVRNDLEDAGYGHLTVDDGYEKMILVTDSDGEFWDSERAAETMQKCIEEEVDLGDDETELVRKPEEGYEYREAMRKERMVWAVTVVEFSFTDLLSKNLSFVD